MDTTQRLAGLIARHAPTDGLHPTGIPGVAALRASFPSARVPVLHQPAICIVAQGTKQVWVGTDTFVYDASKFLVVTVDLPVSGRVLEASAASPYLCFAMDLDVALLTELMAGDAAPLDRGSAAHGLVISPASPALSDTAARLLQLLDTPADIPALAPLLARELHYRLLTGPQAAAVRNLALANGRMRQIGRAIQYLKDHYAEPCSIARLAEEAHMSASTLHAHFKAVTRLSPLQYQKQLRLQEARNLMLGGAMDASTASHAVGYESPSQFTREYRRLFGAPPARDAARQRASAEAAAI